MKRNLNTWNSRLAKKAFMKKIHGGGMKGIFLFLCISVLLCATLRPAPAIMVETHDFVSEEDSWKRQQPVDPNQGNGGKPARCAVNVMATFRFYSEPNYGGYLTHELGLHGVFLSPPGKTHVSMSGFEFLITHVPDYGVLDQILYSALGGPDGLYGVNFGSPQDTFQEDLIKVQCSCHFVTGRLFGSVDARDFGLFSPSGWTRTGLVDSSYSCRVSQCSVQTNCSLNPFS